MRKIALTKPVWATRSFRADGPGRRIRRLQPGRNRPVNAVLAAGVLAAALIQPGPSALTWSVVPTSNVHPRIDNDEFSAVSCVSTADCMAVGLYDGAYPGGAPESAFAESWNGSRWSMVPTPTPANRVLNGVSCTSADWCAAVGFQTIKGQGALLAESWNGAKWTLMPIPQVRAPADLLGVSCVSATDCTAVGQPGPQANALVESWNGRAWSQVPTPGPGSAGGFDTLTAVSCSSARSCAAVGSHDYGPGDVDSAPLAESWNGSHWSAVPIHTTVKNASLHGISCVSTSFCAAAGSYPVGKNANTRTLIEMWNGSRWSAAPVSTRLSETDGVSCDSSVDCWAVGFSSDYPRSSLSHSLADYWNGTKWSAEPLPQAGGSHTSNGADAVSCPSAAGCVIAGDRGAAGSSGLGYNLALVGR